MAAAITVQTFDCPQHLFEIIRQVIQGMEAAHHRAALAGG